MYRVKDKVFQKSAARIETVLESDGYREFESHMLIDAHNCTGRFSVSPHFPRPLIANALCCSGLQSATTFAPTP